MDRHHSLHLVGLLLAILLAPLATGLTVSWHLISDHGHDQATSEPHLHLHRSGADHFASPHHHHDAEGEHSHDASDHIYTADRLNTDALRMALEVHTVSATPIDEAVDHVWSVTAPPCPAEPSLSLNKPSLAQLCTLLI